LEFTPKCPIPVFPLSNLVLFPHAVAPLHVFELRYRAMVQDALRGDRLIAMALLKPGWERDYHSTPEFHPLGCLARLQEVEWLPDNCYDIKVAGMARVRFMRVAREYPYRTASVALMPQEPLPDEDPLVDLERRALVDAYVRVLARGGGVQSPFTPKEKLESVVNAVCMAMSLEPTAKQALLELDSVLERSRRVREALEYQVRRPPSRVGGVGEHN
jgi:Lon protease-like protein